MFEPKLGACEQDVPYRTLSLPDTVRCLRPGLGVLGCAIECR